VSVKKGTFPNPENYCFHDIKRELQASEGMNVDRHLEFQVDATPIGKVSKAMANWCLRLPVYHPTQIPER